MTRVGIVGVGYVGTACAKAMLLRGSCSDIVLIDLPSRKQHTQGVRNDLSHGEPLCRPNRLVVGAYPDLAGASCVVVTAGINEKAGGAIDPADPWGRQRLLPANTRIYCKVVARIVATNRRTPIVVVTDPPDTLADVARAVVRQKRGRNPVISAGTFLDTLRFRIQIAERVGCSARSVEAFVLGEHGKTQVYAWSSARIGGIPLSNLVPVRYRSVESFRKDVAAGVIDANIDIIKATDASQHGIGMVTARIVEAILSGDGLVAPVGTWQRQYGVTLSLPSVIGKRGVVRALPRPTPVTDEERSEEDRVRASAAYLAEALERAKKPRGFERPPALTWAEWSKRRKRV